MNYYGLLLTFLLSAILLTTATGQCTAPFGNTLNTSLLSSSIGNRASQSFTVPTDICGSGRFAQLSIQTATNNSAVTLTICPGEPDDTGFGTDCYEQTGISWQVTALTSYTITLDATDPQLTFAPGDIFTFTFTSESPLNLGRNEIDPLETPVPPNPYPDGSYFNEDDQLEANVDLAFSISTLAPLPVSWAGFVAEPTERGNLLKWRTSAEEDNYGFYVERSSDGRRWLDIGFVAASVTGTAGADYTFLDTESRAGDTWYRLRQEDYDGTTDYSPIVRLRGMENAPGRVYPNPVRVGSSVFVEVGEVPRLVSLYGPAGRRYWQGWIADDRAPLPLPANLPPGIYVVQWRGAAGLFSHRLVVR